MSFMKSLTLVVGLGLVTFCYVFPGRAQAQTNQPTESAQGDHDRTLRQLLTEVRELRLAVQRATVNNSRFQILIERVRVQQSHVEALSRRLDNIRSQLADMRSAQPQMEQQIKEAEELSERATDLNRQAELELRIKEMKGGLARLARESERLRESESSMETEVQANQARLNDLNGQLDALMSELKAP